MNRKHFFSHLLAGVAGAITAFNVKDADNAVDQILTAESCPIKYHPIQPAPVSAPKWTWTAKTWDGKIYTGEFDVIESSSPLRRIAPESSFKPVALEGTDDRVCVGTASFIGFTE
ncbi:hypothetical protein [Dyadobacter sandarakinus]|uniref:Uncharacterized protein n=1 Tax=Dyadobacter sandarakinus TaxID=2747268 RepID=A0ABX7I390_9BACT|nr:hypothetical protein [Dyadobacter sandarakinus]QRQ99702.1 hypothetical protein HWI92_01620 [Dyadobacter sandarakinus]